VGREICSPPRFDPRAVQMQIIRARPLLFYLNIQLFIYIDRVISMDVSFLVLLQDVH